MQVTVKQAEAIKHPQWVPDKVDSWLKTVKETVNYVQYHFG